MKRVGEIIFIIVLAGGMLVPSAAAGQWWLFAVFMIFFTIFGFMEWLSVYKTDRTVSQHFWKLSKKKPVKAWIVLGGMLIAWLALLLHLAWKMLF